MSTIKKFPHLSLNVIPGWLGSLSRVVRVLFTIHEFQSCHPRCPSSTWSNRREQKHLLSFIAKGVCLTYYMDRVPRASTDAVLDFTIISLSFRRLLFFLRVQLGHANLASHMKAYRIRIVQCTLRLQWMRKLKLYRNYAHLSLHEAW